MIHSTTALYQTPGSLPFTCVLVQVKFLASWSSRTKEKEFGILDAGQVEKMRGRGWWWQLLAMGKSKFFPSTLLKTIPLEGFIVSHTRLLFPFLIEK